MVEPHRPLGVSVERRFEPDDVLRELPRGEPGALCVSSA
jgi:hypothetical protein